MTGIELIAAERQRQIEVKNWTAEHDDEHTDGSLAVVAAIVAVSGTDAWVNDPLERCLVDSDGRLIDCWGIIPKWSGDAKQRLAIAGALIAAEIDRLQRQEKTP